jgi:hypothetical protein
VSNTKYFKINFPLGAILSFIIFLYLIINDVWNELSHTLKFIVIIGLIILFFAGQIKIGRTKTEKEAN